MLQGMELTVTNRSQASPEQRVYKKEERLKKFDCGFEGMQL